MEIGENLWEKQFAEAVTRGVPQKKVLLKISRISQKETCVGVSF